MKFARLIVLSFIAATGSLSAQTIEFVTVAWQQSVDQKNASGVVNAGANPYTFRTSVNGTNASPLTGSTFSSVTLGLTNNTVAPYTIAFNATDKEWQYQSTGYADQTALLAAHPTSGTHTYAMNLNGAAATNASVSTSVPFPSIPDLSTSILQAPIVTLSNGTWQGNGTFLVTSVNSAVTLTFNNLYSTTPNATNSFHYDVWINNGVSLTGTTEGFINYNPTNSNTPPAPSTISSLTIAAGQLVDGNTYTLEVGYEQIMASSAILGNAFSAALVGVRSKITIATPLAAVPEPATYALWAGVAVMSGVLVRRRRGS